MIRSVTNRQIQHIVARQAPAAAASSIAVEAAAASSRAFTGAALSDCAYFSFQETSGGGVGHVNSSVPAGASASTSASADSTRGEMAYSLSFSSSSGAASDFSSFASNGFLSPIMRRQLDLVKSPEKHQVQLHQDFAEEERILIQQRTAAMHTMALADDDAAAAAEAAQEEENKEQQHPPSASQEQESHNAAMDSLPLPKTLSSALHPSETRPIVVTESRSPFKIVHVNSAWEDLCGYDRSYASGKTLAEAAQEEEKKEQQHPPSASQAQECHNAMMDSLPLPKTLSSALHPSETRPVVVTESRSPFKIVHVNSAWEDLCGYDRSYASGKTLGSLLGGPDTDKAAATALVTALLRGEEEAGTVLVNYRGGDQVNGTFRNRVRVGPLFGSDDDQRSDSERSQGQVKHFVGVLREI
eukprot:CAMPEP_0197464952 /NCGR_PEP_ID=MMETSP1175-20131217/64290_1 /TAXON_ID=1003142 /ORGANISM="Triceratium dubium, Strain CCMP147" /LENGTH=413 /DNA_ID=CAMNT_0043000955 /DNA_START=307 /DNA_END=1548 /DNA_ORIENTATION=+